MKQISIKKNFLMNALLSLSNATFGIYILHHFIDLPLCNEWLLTSMGVPGTQIHQTALCTYDQSDRYFSARRLGIHSGRIYSGIVLR